MTRVDTAGANAVVVRREPVRLTIRRHTRRYDDTKTHARAVGPERHRCVAACLKAFRDNERVADVGVVRAVTPGER